jgi:hypothetical protein
MWLDALVTNAEGEDVILVPGPAISENMPPDLHWHNMLPCKDVCDLLWFLQPIDFNLLTLLGAFKHSLDPNMYVSPWHRDFHLGVQALGRDPHLSEFRQVSIPLV